MDHAVGRISIAIFEHRPGSIYNLIMARIFETAAPFVDYLSLRRQKGLLSARFLWRSIRFNTRRILARARISPTSPLVTTIAVTSRCPHNCYHCSEGYKRGYEIPADALGRAIDRAVALGCPAIALTGGEPLLRKDLLEVMGRIPLSVIKVIYTSGMGLTADLARALGNTENLLFCLSLDHSDPGEHDRRRNKEGSHRAVMDAIEMMAGTRAELHVSTVTTRDRVLSGELIPFARDLRARGVACLQMFQPRPVGRLGYGEQVLLRPEDERKLLDTAREINRDPLAPLVLSYPSVEHASALGCCGGYARVYIDSHGNVCPCDFAPLSFGNIIEDDFAEVWKRMRGFYSEPGSRCQVLHNPEIFESEREGRNVCFPDIGDPSPLRSEPPAIFREMGEGAYRLLLSNLIVASIAADRRCDGG